MMSVLDSDSDWESYSDASDGEDQDSTESVFGGHARSILSSLDASIRKIDDFLALDRGFMHGDFVSAIITPSGQIGRVVGVDMTVNLESIYGEIIKDVDSKELLRIRSFSVGDYVVYGPWLGKVDKVYDLVTVLFDDGGKCRIYAGDRENLVPLSSHLLEDAPYPYYPGQRVQMRHSAPLKSTRWLCGTWNGSRDDGIVSHAEIGLVHVNWIASVMVGCNVVSSSPPPVLQDPKDLTLLSCYIHASWQLGDWCKLPQDYFQVLQMATREQASPHIAPQCVTKMQKFGMNHHAYEPVYVIAKTRTKVDILWQDGSHSVGVDPCHLIPANSVGDHEFWPEQIVLQKATSEDARGSSAERMGIVRYMDAQERTVKIRWLLPELSHSDDSTGEFDEEIVSAYELHEHPDYNYCLGDIVFRYLLHFEHLGENLSVTQADGPRQLPEVHPINKKQSLEVHDNYASHYLSYIGNVIGFKDGGIEVKWASGLVSTVKPYEVFGLDRFDVIVATAVNSNEVAEETVGKESEQDKRSWHQKEEDLPLINLHDSEKNCRKNLWDARALFFPRAALGFLSNVATILFGHHGSTSLSGTEMSGYFEGHNKCCSPRLETPALQITEESERQIMHPEHAMLHNEKLRQNSLVNQETVGVHDPLAVVVARSKTEEFKQFGVGDDYSDHHFIDEIGKGLGLAQVKRGWLKKVQEEWSILEKNLPDTIYVRVYEERLDLLRASIVGARGTPYHDALFFFDICFPPDYPHEPPVVYYNSGGLRLNPNLYESGKVCLSLLKTWSGTDNEVWNPERSTVLQVLLSLQALVLNEKPYFNEAGYDKQIGRAEGERNSITYNENAFLLSCKSMLYLLRKPPKNFEQFVLEHFTRQSPQILLACKAYMEGAQVGCTFEHGHGVPEGQKSSSTGFKIMLAKLFPMLVSGFSEIGIDCSQFLDCAKRACE
uniref:E2 ubiquitin-conjugating enzyme n=1 Tax=Anthurium amnicola TaxID=1678845 RepID=A0A1D1Y099_9ARAE